MSKITGKPPTHWRRPMTRTYDYNTTLGENYYKPQLDYIESRRGRGKTPPSATTFAERLLKYNPSNSRRSASASRRAEEASEEVGLSTSLSRGEESLGRYSSLDDLGLDDDNLTRRRRQLLLRSSQENLDEDLSPRIRRVAFGDKLLDAVGVRESSVGSSAAASSQQQQSSSLSSSSRVQQQRKTMFASGEEDALDKILADRKNRRQIGVIQSAEADLFSEDPLKSPRLSSRIQSARQQMDDMREKMRDDADASTSRFRTKIRQRREREQMEDQLGSSSLQSSSKAVATSGISSSTSSALKLKSSSSLSSSAQNLMLDDDDAETAAILSKVEEIRKRAKARMAAITDDFPDLQIESSLASRRAANRSRLDLDDDLDSDFSSSRLANASSGGSGRSVTMSKRTVRASYDIE
ncbi:unnamed protein product [Orchesella dallaii]|uniref:Paramyosin n=1 Tax=Orchesella dallaii TaxID=48710 RepID=A0ABP1QMU6_9HEXA